jgi:hypothetical protein
MQSGALADKPCRLHGNRALTITKKAAALIFAVKK